MNDLTNEQSRTYTWILKDQNTPSLKLTQPLSLYVNDDGGHTIHGSDNCMYVVRDWQILKVELKGGVSPEQKEKIIIRE